MNAESSSSKSGPNTNQNVRRNIFYNYLGQRSTSSSSSTTASTIQTKSQDPNGEIAARDSHGNYQFEMPELPKNGEGDSTQEAETTREKERMEARLVELYRNRARAPSDPAELLEAIRASLKTKVDSLEDDKWMFEPENDPSN